MLTVLCHSSSFLHAHQSDLAIAFVAGTVLWLAVRILRRN